MYSSWDAIYIRPHNNAGQPSAWMRVNLTKYTQRLRWGDVTFVPQRLKIPATCICVQHYVQANNNNENTKALQYWPVFSKCFGDEQITNSRTIHTHIPPPPPPKKKKKKKKKKWPIIPYGTTDGVRHNRELVVFFYIWMIFIIWLAECYQFIYVPQQAFFSRFI